MVKKTILAGLVSLSLLSGCGFTPMYAKTSPSEHGTQSSTVTQGLQSVDIALIPNREGQMLRNMLMDRFYAHGTPASPKYTLKIEKLGESKSELDITKNEEATRAQLSLTTKLHLLDEKGTELLTRDISAITSYNVLQSEFATRVTEQSARENAIGDLARQIELTLALFLNGTK